MIGRCKSGIVMILGLILLAGSARSEVNLTYLGAFEVSSVTNVYNGDLTYYPSGNSGAGSLFISRGTVVTTTGYSEVYEVAIPTLVNTTDIDELNSVTPLQGFDTADNPRGMVWRSSDDKLYYSSGGVSPYWRSIGRDGSNESSRQQITWSYIGDGLCQIPDAWATSYAGGKNVVGAGFVYGIRLQSVDPWNNPMASPTALVAYDTSHRMNGYDSSDTIYGVTWVSVDGEDNIIVAGTDNSASAATLWFYDADDIAGASNAYDPQPYQTVSVQSCLFSTDIGTQHLSGITYDAGHEILYGYESAYGAPLVVHAWSVGTPDVTAPSAVTDLATSNPTGASITLSWTAPGDDGSTGTAASYDIRYSTSTITEGNWASATQVTGEPTPAAGGTSDGMTVSGLTGNTTYYFAMKTSDEVPNVSSLSNVASATTADNLAPSAVTDLATSNPTGASITLSWTAPGDDGSSGTAASYDIRYSTSTITEGNWSSATQVTGEPSPAAGGTSDGMTVSGLTGNTTYYFAMKTSDEVPNVSSLSNVANATTADNVAPAAVTDLATSDPTATSITLSWTSPGDDGSTGTAANYDIRYSTSTITEANWASATQVTGEPTPAIAGTSQNVTVSDLSSGTTYYFAMKTSDEVPNISSLSNVASAGTATPAGSSLDLTYLGAFKVSSVTNVYNGDLTYYPSGNSNAGSLFISKGSAGSGSEVYEVAIPTLVITTDIEELNSVTPLQGFDTADSPRGMVWRSTDDKLYYSAGGVSPYWRSIGRDGSNESSRQQTSFGYIGDGLCQIPDAWASSYAGGKNVVGAGFIYGIRLQSVDPWNNPMASPTALVAYDTSNRMNDYDSSDTVYGVAWASVGGVDNIIVAGTDNSASAAMLWFYDADDIAGASNVYDPQPYKTVSVQSSMFSTDIGTQHLSGITYDAENQILYGYEGAYGAPTVVHAWSVSSLSSDTTAPAAVTNLAAGSPTATSITLSWTSPGDDSSTGTADSYDIRYSTSTITEANWASATQVTGEPTPAVAGTNQSMTVSGLSGSTTYYFAMKTSDEVPNVSSLSNVASATTSTSDSIAPAAVTDLATSSPTNSTITLSWTSPGDDGSSGTASSYDVRYSTSTITEANWASATQATGEPTPAVAGTNQNVTVSGLTYSTTYYFAMKTSDEVPNVSSLSNVASTATTAPADSSIDLTYLGAFKVSNVANVYNGDLTYYPSGNSGAGSLFISRGTVVTTTGYSEVYEVAIPTLVNTTDIDEPQQRYALAGIRHGQQSPRHGLAQHR